MSKSTNVMVDLEDRDPNNLSNHLQVNIIYIKRNISTLLGNI